MTYEDIVLSKLLSDLGEDLLDSLRVSNVTLESLDLDSVLGRDLVGSSGLIGRVVDDGDAFRMNKVYKSAEETTRRGREGRRDELGSSPERTVRNRADRSISSLSLSLAVGSFCLKRPALTQRKPGRQRVQYQILLR